jgi:hypothetical protein
LGEHSRSGTKILHFVGTTLFLACAVSAALFQNFWLFVCGPVFAYSCAWVGHFFIEKNRPATFQWPLYSLVGDFKMYFELLMRKRSF